MNNSPIYADGQIPGSCRAMAGLEDKTSRIVAKKLAEKAEIGSEKYDKLPQFPEPNLINDFPHIWRLSHRIAPRSRINHRIDYIRESSNPFIKLFVPYFQLLIGLSLITGISLIEVKTFGKLPSLAINTPLNMLKDDPAGNLPLMVPIRYDLQLQLPTASTRDPLVPTFFGSIRIDFQLTRHLFALSGKDKDREDSSRNGDDEGDSALKHHEFRTIRDDVNKWHSPRFPEARRVSPLSGAFVELRLAARQLDAFENVTLRAAGGGRLIPALRIRLRNGEAIFRLAEPNALAPGRYTLNIERFQGLITYQKGIYYRDAGGFPVLGMDLFPNYTHTVFPCMGGPLTKTTVRLALIHPRDTVALSSMHQRDTPRQLNENWRVTKFVQAPNLAAYMFAVAVLPVGVYERTVVSREATGGLPLHIWTNRVVHRAALKQELARQAARVYAQLVALIGEPLPLAHLDVLAMNEFNGTHSFGVVTVGCEEWDASDEAHRLALLARQFARQWFGGVTTVADFAHFCIQEDIAEFLASKVVGALLRGAAAERFALAQYVRMQLAEVFLAPGETVTLRAGNAFASAPSMQTIETHCGLKGAQMLRSLETVTAKNESGRTGGADDSANVSQLVRKLRQILKFQRYKSFTFDDILDQLRGQVVDSIDLAQVYEFWARSGGLPNVLVEKSGDRLRLTQLNRRRSAQRDAGGWAPMPLWPLRVAVRNLSLPLTFMVSKALELAPLDPKLLALTNPNFEHWYRVNYDAVGWERIARNFGASLEQLSARSRAQLLNDFCYFNAVRQIDEGAAEALRAEFVRLMRDHYEHFELCELYAFWCAADAGRRKINMDAAATSAYYALARDRLLPALRHHRGYECGGPGAVADAANQLCQLVFGKNCL